MQHLYPFAVAVVIMVVSFSGVLFSAELFKTWMHRNLTYLATFAGGVFLLVVFHLLTETFNENASLALAAGSILFGAALMQALHRLLPDTHHHHNVEHDHTHSRIDGRRVLISDAFHNVGDGVLLVATFAVSIPVGLAASVGIIVHELVQEISEFFILRESGYATRRALVLNFFSSTTVLIGVALATFLASADAIAILFAGIAAGGFLIVLIQDVLPNMIRSIEREGGAWKHLLAGALGIMFMLGVQMLFPHEEPASEIIPLAHQTQGTQS